MTRSTKKDPRDETDTSLIERFRSSDHPAVSLGRDLVWVALVVGGIALLLFLVFGTWPAVVTIESGSMLPEMQIGDLVFVAAPDRFGSLVTAEEGAGIGHTSFGHPGDVIIFRPNGNEQVHPIIHRAIIWIDSDTAASELGLENTDGGIITKGDNNPVIDQVTIHPGLGRIEPVRDEWIIGKAVFRIPLIGYLPLNIWKFAAVVVAIIIIQELIASRRRRSEER